MTRVELTEKTDVIRRVPKSVGSKTITKFELGVNVDAAVQGLELGPDHARGNIIADRHETLCDRIEPTVNNVESTSVFDPPRRGGLSLSIGGLSSENGRKRSRPDGRGVVLHAFNMTPHTLGLEGLCHRSKPFKRVGSYLQEEECGRV
jgi:hypothetical protein